jgi:hypothetical protein
MTRGDDEVILLQPESLDGKREQRKILSVLLSGKRKVLDKRGADSQPLDG